MTRLFTLMLLPLVPLWSTPAASQEVEETPVAAVLEEPAPMILSAVDTSLDEWIWQKRLVIVFSDSPNDPRFVQQLEFLQERLESLKDRDVLILTDTDPSEPSAVRQELRARGFMLVVLAKDGSVVIRKPAPWDAREISRSIDKLPLRRQEVAER